MTTIIGIQTDDMLLELSSPDSEKFGKFFEIDSINLLLGKNGSGKTRLLLLIANAISSQDEGEAKFYFKKNRTSAVKLNRQDICAIYYSALPYKRKPIRRSGTIDASPRAQNTNQAERLLSLGEVATALGINTRLTGYFGYTRKVYRSILIPALRTALDIPDSKLKLLLRQSNSKDVDVDMTNRSETTKEIYEDQEKITKKIEYILESQIDYSIPGYDKILYLSSLEYMGNNEERFQSAQAAMAFISHVGLTNDKVQTKHFEELEDLVEKTRETLSYYADPDDFDDRDRAHNFQIDGVSNLAAIRRYDTPIKIEWDNLSSGLQALVEQFSLIGDAVGEAVVQGRSSILLLIDEGDAYLHLEWQRRYISLINQYLGKLKRQHGLQSLQLILATHSPLLAADLPGEFVKNLDSDEKIKTFAAPLEEVISGSFESSSLGEFAASKINEIYKRAKDSNLTETDIRVIESIGDPGIRSAISREILK